MALTPGWGGRSLGGGGTSGVRDIRPKTMVGKPSADVTWVVESTRWKAACTLEGQ